MSLSDTTPAAAALQTAIHRRLGADGRFRVAIEISDLVREPAEAGARVRAADANQTVVLGDLGRRAPSEAKASVSVRELFVRIRAALDAAGIPHMLTGSFASSLHGTPRATQDIDIVIAPTRDQLPELLSHLPESQYYVSLDATLDALQHHDQFTVIDVETGWKVNLIIRKPRAFSREEFERRRPVEVSGATLERRRRESPMESRPMSGVVTAVSRSGSHTMSKPAEGCIRLIAGVGVEGDAHAGGTVKHRSRVARDPSRPNLRQVHLIHAELHDGLAAGGFTVTAGQMGENVTTRGVDLLGLPTGARLHLGSKAVVEITGLRNPCAQLDTIQPGLMAATLERDEQGNLIRKAGVMSIVLHGGDVRPGDPIRVELPPEPRRPLEPV